jgi:hypothetical protein
MYLKVSLRHNPAKDSMDGYYRLIEKWISLIITTYRLDGLQSGLKFILNISKRLGTKILLFNYSNCNALTLGEY